MPGAAAVAENAEVTSVELPVGGSGLEAEVLLAGLVSDVEGLSLPRTAIDSPSMEAAWTLTRPTFCQIYWVLQHACWVPATTGTRSVPTSRLSSASRMARMCEPGWLSPKALEFPYIAAMAGARPQRKRSPIR